MPPLPIVEYLDVFGDLSDGLFPRLVATVMNKFVLERTPEALHGSIIIAIAFLAHGCSHLELVHQTPVFMGTVLNPTIRMVDQPWAGPFGCHSFEQRLAHNVLGDPISHGISNDLSCNRVSGVGPSQLNDCQRDSSQKKAFSWLRSGFSGVKLAS